MTSLINHQRKLNYNHHDQRFVLDQQPQHDLADVSSQFHTPRGWGCPPLQDTITKQLICLILQLSWIKAQHMWCLGLGFPMWDDITSKFATEKWWKNEVPHGRKTEAVSVQLSVRDISQRLRLPPFLHTSFSSMQELVLQGLKKNIFYFEPLQPAEMKSLVIQHKGDDLMVIRPNLVKSLRSLHLQALLTLKRRELHQIQKERVGIPETTPVKNLKTFHSQALFTLTRMHI